jgi:uncharacterized protein (TIRG00374 family)
VRCFLWLAFRGLQPAQFWASVQTANAGLLILGMVVYGVAVTIITLRWRFLLRAIKPIPLTKLIPLVSIGYMGNNIYPFRSGEVLRIFLLRRNHDVPYARGATTVLVERVFDGLVMLGFVLVPLTFLDSVPPTAQQIAEVVAIPFVAALIIFFVLAARPGILHRIAEWVANLLPERLGGIVTSLADEIIGGLEGLRSPLDLVGTIVSSYATWAVEASVYWIVMFAFGIETSYLVALLAVGAVNLAGLLPAAPGNLGVFELILSEVLVIAAGVDNPVAVACAIAIHIVIWLPPTLAGFVFLAQQGLNLSAVTQADQLQKKAVG